MYVIVLFALLAGALAEQRLPGRCDIDNLKHIPVDNISSFADRTWYLYASFGSEWIGGDCPTAVTHLDHVHPETVLDRDILFLKNDKIYNISRPFVLHHKDDFRQNFNSFTEEESKPVTYYILDADVHSHALLYSCVQESPETKIVSAQLYTLKKNYSSDIEAKLYELSQDYEELKQGNWKLHDHTKCSF